MFIVKKVYVSPDIKMMEMECEGILAGSGKIGFEEAETGPEIPVIGDDTGLELAGKDDDSAYWE